MSLSQLKESIKKLDRAQLKELLKYINSPKLIKSVRRDVIDDLKPKLNKIKTIQWVYDNCSDVYPYYNIQSIDKEEVYFLYEFIDNDRSITLIFTMRWCDNFEFDKSGAYITTNLSDIGYDYYRHPMTYPTINKKGKSSRLGEFNMKVLSFEEAMKIFTTTQKFDDLYKRVKELESSTWKKFFY